MVADLLPMENASLGAVSLRLASTLLAAFPEFKPHAKMLQGREAEGFSFYLLFPSPTHDDVRALEIWVDEVCTPSIGFGATHTHEDSDDLGIAQIIDRARAILEDQILIIEDADGEYRGHTSWIDLRLPDSLEEELTSPYSSSRVWIKSWSGKEDREIVKGDMGTWRN